jgi:hypothetical protein
VAQIRGCSSRSEAHLQNRIPDPEGYTVQRFSFSVLIRVSSVPPAISVPPLLHFKNLSHNSNPSSPSASSNSNGSGVSALSSPHPAPAPPHRRRRRPWRVRSGACLTSRSASTSARASSARSTSPGRRRSALETSASSPFDFPQNFPLTSAGPNLLAAIDPERVRGGAQVDVQGEAGEVPVPRAPPAGD